MTVRTSAVRVRLVEGQAGRAAGDRHYEFCSRRGAEDPFAGSAEYTFHTPRPPGSRFTFTMTADSHLNAQSDPVVYRQTLANALADAPNFHIDLGDTFMTEKHASRESAARQDVAQRYYFGLIGHSAPLYLVLGNHDGESGRYLHGIVYQEVPQPGPRRYNTPRTAAEYGYVQGAILGGPGHLRIAVSPDRVAIDFVSSRLPEDETADRRNREVRYHSSIP